MPEWLSIFLTFLLISSASLGISFLAAVLKDKFAQKETPTEQVEDPKIYYITETPKKVKRKKTRKKPTPALKGIIISPEQFKKIDADKNGAEP